MSQQVGVPEEPTEQLQPKGWQALEPRRTNISIQIGSQRKANILVEGGQTGEIFSFSSEGQPICCVQASN